jgi:hypothetical protein
MQQETGHVHYWSVFPSVKRRDAIAPYAGPAGAGEVRYALWSCPVPSPGAWLIVIGHHSGPPVADAALAIAGELTRCLRGPTVLIRRLPATPGSPEHWDQLRASDGEPDWERVWPDEIPARGRAGQELARWLLNCGQKLGIVTQAQVPELDRRRRGPRKDQLPAPQGRRPRAPRAHSGPDARRSGDE